MNASTSDTTCMRLARRVRWLYVVHAGLIGFWFLWGPIDSHTLNDATRLGFFLAETSLAAMLAAFVPASARSRWLSGALACIWTLVLFDQVFAREGGIAALLLLTVLIVVLGGALALRFQGRGLGYYALDQPLPVNEPLRLTIRQLLLGTLVVVVVAALAYGLSSRIDGAQTLTVSVFLVLFLFNPFLVLWAALGRGDPRVRGILVLIIAVSVGTLPAFDSLSGREPWWFYPAAFAMQATVMLETLWVVRSCRYRLGPTSSLSPLEGTVEIADDPLAAPWNFLARLIGPKLSLFKCLPWPIWLLIVVFVGIDQHLAWHLFEYDGDWAFNTFIVLPIAQAGIMAILCVLANVRWLYRIVLAAAGLMALLWLVHRTLEDAYAVPFIAISAALVFAAMFGTCVLLRERGFSLQRFDAATTLPRREPFRFSIAQLMVLTSLVALLFASWQWYDEIDEPDVLLVVTILSLHFLPGALLALWAGLESHHLIVRCALALILGTAPAILPDLHLDLSSDPWGLWIWPFFTCLNTSLILVSLLVVRSCGYRLVRSSSADSRSVPNLGPDNRPNQVHP